MEVKEIVDKINKSNSLISKHRYTDADKILDDLLKEIEPIEINRYGRVLDFSSRLEFFLYCHMEKRSNTSWTRNFLSDIYLIKGIISYENRNFKVALDFFEKGLKWNPASIHIYNECLEACINLRDYDKFDIYFEKAMKYAIRPIDLAMLYKKLGFVYIERGQEEIAYNLFLYSKLFFPRQEADGEIAFLEKRFGTRLKHYPDLGTIEYLKEKNLLYKRPNYIVPTYFAVIKSMEDIIIKEKFQTRENYLQLIDYYHGLYFHRPGGQIHSAMLSIQRDYELKFPVNKEE